jgi:Fe-S-cluster containining protein
MRLQIIDPTVNFACSSCTRCCDQPWRTVVESEKLAAIDAVDWPAQFPDMAGRTIHRTVKADGRMVHELGKGEGTRCVFLHDNGLCRIHMQLGYDAKPQMCKQFPFIGVRGWEADFVSANYGCRAVQRSTGPAMTQQVDAVAAIVPLSDTPARTDAPYLLTATQKLPQATAGRLLEHLGKIAVGDESLPDQVRSNSINGRLAVMLDTVERVIEADAESVDSLLASGSLSHAVEAERYAPYESACAAPMPSRFLFAATLFPDTLPADMVGELGFVRRLTLIPRLLTLAQMRGAYASRLLGRNVRVDAVMSRAARFTVAPEAVDLLGRYLRSRLWQHFPSGTRLPIASAIHQHILDMNAVVFYAVAEAPEAAGGTLDLAAIERALMHVEFHLANQPRLHASVLKGWLRGALAGRENAWASLRMMRCAAGQVAPVRGDVLQEPL